MLGTMRTTDGGTMSLAPMQVSGETQQFFGCLGAGEGLFSRERRGTRLRLAPGHVAAHPSDAKRK